MALETEAKIKVADHQALRNQLDQLGAECLGRCFEVNTYFDTPDQQMLASDRGLRLRCTEQKTVLTYKGPQQPGPYKQREEIQTTVGDAAATRALLEHLGFGQSLLFEKRRERWHLDHCRIELDTVPELGCYVEIEGPNPTEIAQVIERLELDGAEVIKKPYPILLLEHFKQTGRRCTEVRFQSQAPSQG